jgi:hypothetical protein
MVASASVVCLFACVPLVLKLLRELVDVDVFCRLVMFRSPPTLTSAGPPADNVLPFNVVSPPERVVISPPAVTLAPV